MDILTLILVALGVVILIFIGYLLGRKLGYLQAQKELPDIIKAESEKSVKQSRAVLGGQFLEQLAPYLPDFPYSPTEVRFIGKPIDFIVFKGMDNKHIEEVVFVEVKTGKSSLSPPERILRDVINDKKVKWEEYKAPGR
ncbi:MAG: Holliday junction resolvase-like protein [Candidatus Hydrothermarchaeota archaeon]